MYVLCRDGAPLAPGDQVYDVIKGWRYTIIHVDYPKSLVSTAWQTLRRVSVAWLVHDEKCR